MTYTTFFEIGGHVVESHVVQSGQPQRPVSITPRSISKKTGVPVPLVKQASKEFEQKTGYDVMRASGGYGRLRRARWAFTTAAAIAAADGPLPFGDAAAIAFLAGYGVYETVTGIGDFVQR